MAEWTKAAILKIVVGKTTVGSNPTFAALGVMMTVPKKCKTLCRHKRQCFKFTGHEYDHNFVMSCFRCRVGAVTKLEPAQLWAGTEYEMET